MDAATVEKLTQEYLQSAITEWEDLDSEDESSSATLEDAFVLLQAEEKSNKENKEEVKTRISFSLALKQTNHLVLLGEPGSGKSTIMKFLGVYFAGKEWAEPYIEIKEKQKHVPIFISLQAHTPFNFNIREMIIKEIGSFLINKMTETNELYDEWAQENNSYQLIFLFDGLDEVENNKNDVQRLIRRFADSDIGKRSRIIISSRITGFSKFPETFKEVTIEPLRNDVERIEFLAKWLTALKNEQPIKEAEVLLKKLHQEPALNSILDNPLSLQMIAKIYHDNKTIPSNRSDIYKKYFYRIAEQRKLTLERNTLELQNIEKALQSIAWHMHNNGKRDKTSLLTALELYGKVKTEETEKLFSRVYDKLNIIGGRDDKLKFSHPTIQEYFVSERLKAAWKKDPKITWKFIRPCLHLPTWKVPLSLLVAGLEEKDRVKFITKVKMARSRYESKLHRDYFLAAKLIGESGSDSHKLQRPYFLQTFNPNSKKRSLAIRACGYIGGEIAVDLILRGYFGKNEFIRESASDAVIELDEKSFFFFVESLEKDERLWALTRFIMLRLSDMGGQKSIEVLTQVIKENSYHRARAVYFLSRIGDPTTVPLIVQTLFDEDDDVVETSIKALSKFHADAIPYFRQALDEHKGENHTISDEEAKSKHRSPHVYNANVRYWICEALGNIGSTECIPALLQLLDADKDDGVKRAASEALAKVGDISVIHRVLSLIALHT